MFCNPRLEHCVENPTTRYPTLILIFILFGGTGAMIGFYFSGGNMIDPETKKKLHRTRGIIIGILLGLFMGITAVAAYSSNDRPTS